MLLVDAVFCLILHVALLSNLADETITTGALPESLREEDILVLV